MSVDDCPTSHGRSFVETGLVVETVIGRYVGLFVGC